jgi:hypothetical protein
MRSTVADLDGVLAVALIETISTGFEVLPEFVHWCTWPIRVVDSIGEFLGHRTN